MITVKTKQQLVKAIEDGEKTSKLILWSCMRHVSWQNPMIQFLVF